MTKRAPISSIQNIWFDAEQVDNTDLSLEQQYNNTIQSSIINNHIGNGILSEVLSQHIIFDSYLFSGFLDGLAIQSQSQPIDNNYGNQFEIELTDSKVVGKKSIKICIIGLDFDSNLQYETFVFTKNESQISKRHFTKILILLFNDFVGDPLYSMNLGGRIVIKEVKPMSLSRDPIMVSQDIEPNLFFRDFYISTGISLQVLLQTALPFYNIDTLNIFTSSKDQLVLLNNDIVIQIGQKFIAYTNNIQKITLLLSVRNLLNESDLAWTGDLVISIHPLQSNIECPTDIAPNLAIDFSPSNIPIAQISINYDNLNATGIILNSVPQPVDFVFSNSPIASGNILTVNSYYAFTVKRAGSANKCDILMEVGADRVSNSRITTFTGIVWVDIPEEDLWFQIWTDSAKVSDGQAYESGSGIIIPKTILDLQTQTTIDFSYDGIQFVGNDVYRAVVSAITKESDPIPSQRTGQPVNSKQQLIPEIKLLNTIDITNLLSVAEPFLIGAISDKNIKFFDPSQATIISRIHSATIINDELIIRIITDSTDIGRYDTSVNSLETNLLNGDLINAKIIPDADRPGTYYRIASATLCSMILGDVNGDGIIDINDLNLLNSYLGYNFDIGLPINTTIVTDGYSTTYINGYTTYTVVFSNAYSVNFQLVNPINNLVIASGSDGVLIANPTDNRLAQFTSSSVSFKDIVSLSSYKLVVLDSLAANHGSFDIVSIDTITDVISIRKIFLDGDSISQMLRADVDGDFHITLNDGYLLQSYIERVPYTESFYETYPSPATQPYTNIGTRFNIIRIKVEKFVDRNDDYSSVTIGRSTEIHPIQDIFMSDGYFASHNFYTLPVAFAIQKQLSWEEDLIVTNSRPKLVPSVFTTLTGFSQNSCSLDKILINTYPNKLDFDSGRVDFFAPDNIIIGESGEFYRPDGNLYKVDFELGTIVLEIPNGLFGDERTINILQDFIASVEIDEVSTGITSLGYPAMKFADCSYVTIDALTNDQVRFSVAVQSFSPNTNGISSGGYSGAIVDGKMGVAIDYSTGLLTLNFTNLFQDTILKTLSTKIQISVYLKKGSFNNKPLFVDSTQVKNMLKLISVFSGPTDNGPSTLIDLEADITGILPIVHGGTGLNSTGTQGTVLTSNSGSLSYQFSYDLVGVIAYSAGISNANRIPKTDGYGRLDPSFLYKNPVYIYGSAGTFSHDSSLPQVISAFTFRFDRYILQGLSSIRLETILETTNVTNTASIKLFNVTSGTYLALDGYSYELSTTNTITTVLISDDLSSKLLSGANDYVYEIHLMLDPSSVLETAICKMARLVITYNNPYAVMPPLAETENFVPYLPII